MWMIIECDLKLFTNTKLFTNNNLFQIQILNYLFFPWCFIITIIDSRTFNKWLMLAKRKSGEERERRGRPNRFEFWIDASKWWTQNSDWLSLDLFAGMVISNLNLKIEQRNAVASLLEDTTFLLSVQIALGKSVIFEQWADFCQRADLSCINFAKEGKDNSGMAY